jgi:hypothetical protein
MRRESEAIARKRTFLIVRYVLILATGALAFAETAAQQSPLPVAALVAVALISNLALSSASSFSFFDASVQAPILIADTSMVSVALLLSRADQEFFLFFFFVLIMAAKVENLVLLAVGAALIGLASFLISSPGPDWATPSLLRIPFLFASGIFFGYVVLPERTGEMTPMNLFGSRPSARGARLHAR